MLRKYVQTAILFSYIILLLTIVETLLRQVDIDNIIIMHQLNKKNASGPTKQTTRTNLGTSKDQQLTDCIILYTS